MLTEDELNWIRKVLDDYEPGISASYFYRRDSIIERNKNKGNVRKELDSLRKKMIKYTPQELLELKSKKVRESRDVNNFSGIYIIHNCVRDLYYIGQSVKVFDRAYTHFVKNQELKKGRYEMNVQFNLPEIYHDYNLGDKFSISLIPLEDTSFSTLNELEDNAIRAYDSLVPNGYNRNPGNILDKPIFANDDFEKAANLILDKIKGTEIFLTLTNNRKRLWYSIDLLSELGLPKNLTFSNNLAELIKVYQKANKKSGQKKTAFATVTDNNEKQDLNKGSRNQLDESKRVEEYNNKRAQTTYKEFKIKKPRIELGEEDISYEVDKKDFMEGFFKLLKYAVLIFVFGMVVKWMLF
ncbi:excinuclease ABC subunit C [Bacillus wiedmannii]|uniref:excinuclease ABC subunit C n=1 Tax=Bacillus wiedmannii TaxID=1890302 RepID=UPI0020D27673|nr:excinuclease ABC subunit C [Bacillus wiedmannii]